MSNKPFPEEELFHVSSHEEFEVVLSGWRQEWADKYGFAAVPPDEVMAWAEPSLSRFRKDIERLQSREERRKRRPSTPDADEHFRKLHDEEGKSYAWIAERDPLARAMGLDRKDVINHVNSARRRNRNRA